MGISSVKIVGSGLIGTSIGLALSQRGVSILMADSNPSAASLAQSLVNPGQIFESDHHFDLVVIAVPPSSFHSVISTEASMNPLSTFVDILSIKTKPQVEVEALGDLASRFIGSHPMAGREVVGAQSARGDLFTGRSWIICPSQQSSKNSEDVARELIQLCGGVAVRMSAREHDRAMALVSHTPQVVASLMAATLKGQESIWFDLIGQGFRDLTRIADSDPQLWSEILSENAPNIREILAALRTNIETIEEKLDNQKFAHEIIQAGNAARALIPGKHGGAPRKYVYLHIVIDDKAGQLAAIFNDCARAQVNIEDVSIEHTPGQNTGLVTLSILEAKNAEFLEEFLTKEGWKVHLTRK
jgi:prephenate dehydrogenase